MTNILAIDTSSNYCSVALNRNGQIDTRVSPNLRHHAQELLPMISDLLATASISLAQLDGIAVVVGPGSFTGIRIGTGVAQGLAFGADIPVIGVSSLAVMAMRANLDHGIEQCWVALTARENEIYAASYAIANNVCVLQGKELVVAPQEVKFIPFATAVAGVGSGWEYAGVMLQQQGNGGPQIIHIDVCCDASALSVIAAQQFEQGASTSPEKVLPVYIKEEMDYKA